MEKDRHHEERLSVGEKAGLALLVLMVVSWAFNSNGSEGYDPSNPPIEPSPTPITTPTRSMRPPGYRIEDLYKTATVEGTHYTVPVRPNVTPTSK